MDSNLSRAVASGNVRRYRAARAILIEQMGGACVYCGSAHELQFHHTVERTWRANKTSRWCRIARYRRDWHAGHLVLACAGCNNDSLRRPAADNTIPD